MKKTFKGALALVFCIVTVFATMIVVSALGAPKAKVGKITYNSVTISWAKIKDADFYEVQRSTDGKKWTTLNKSVKGTSYKDSNKLTAGKSYKYRVRAVDDRKVLKDIYSSWSKAVSGKPVPEKVTELKASSKTHNSVKLTWKKVSGASGYEVQVKNGDKWKSVKKVKENSLTVSKLTLGKTYQYRVRAYRTVSKKAVYGAVSSTLKTGPQLKTPSSPVLTSVSANTVKLSWGSVTGAKGYEVYNTVTKKWTNVKTAKSITVKSLKAGTKYGFQVRAYAGSHKGTQTAVRYFTTTPATPGSVKVTSASTSSITFSWGKVTGAAGYQPAYYNYATKKWVNLATTTKTSVTVSKLSAAAKYGVRVRAYLKNSNVKDISATTYSGWSSTIDTYTVPSAPKSIKLTGIATTSLKITWSGVTGATSYEYYNPVTKKWVSAGKNTSATVSGLAAGTKYTFKVKAVVSNRKSAESAGYSFLTKPAAPTSLKASGITSSAITISWKKVTGAAGYQLEYKTSGGSWKKLTTTSTSATVSGLANYTDYYFRVIAHLSNSNVSGIDAKSYSSYSSELKATTKIGKPSVSTAATSTDTITVKWAALKGAVNYKIEKFDTYENDWTVYDFTTATWRLEENLNENSVIKTTALSLADKAKASRTDAYRVTGFDSKDNAYVSNVVNGTTSDLALSVGDYSITFTVPKLENISQYQVYTRNPDNSTELLLETNTNKITLNLAPSSYITMLIVGKGSYITEDGDKRETSTAITNWCTFRTNDLKLVTSTSDKNYNASVNSQLLYLARAINNTKAYQGDITVKNQSEISYRINYLKIMGLEAKKTSDIPKLLKALSILIPGAGDLSKDFPTEETEKINATLSFKDGKCINEGNTNVRLKIYIEPTSNSTKTAYLYNGLTSQSAWKNGFESVATTKNSDGSYTIKATLKKESKNTNYHSGFISSFNLSDFSGDGFEMQSFEVGKTTLSAVIDSEGYLKSYSVNSPYNAAMAADIGDAMSMKMGGNSSFAYTITR